jgi:CBS domain-containing protein
MAGEDTTMSPPPTTAAALARLEERIVSQTDKIDELKEQVGKINEKLYGNGTDGLVVDQLRQSAQIEKLISIAEGNAKCIQELKAETAAKFLSKNWRTLLMLAVAFFLILHSIIPADMSLWSWFSKFFGGG